ncbi:MAG: ribonuclease J, partial [Candidatus Levybacteria bacterium]|nr:ribonuclease J [Candidatus Levybacteria bacterium]
MENLSFISLGGIGDVTKNMSVYQFGNEILLVDCGIGFVDESMPGVDLVIPNVSYLKRTNKKIVGMILTHGHEDHIGALPFVLPLLPKFPIYASTLTAALANEKLKEFGESYSVQTGKFEDTVKLGSFSISFARVTHSIIDAANLLIRTPIGNFYHGSDFKFDFTPVDGRPSEIRKIAKWGEEGILCTLSDCLGAERPGHSKSELNIGESFDDEVRKTRGKVFITTYSSNISRMNQAIEVARKYGRRVCFMGRSFLKSRDIGRKLKYLDLPVKSEIRPQDVKRVPPNQVMLLVAGSQAQIESALVRISEDQDQDIRIQRGDAVIFSADPIPGNEVSIHGLIDTISKREARVVYSEITDEFHVSGHGSQNDLKLLLSLTNPRFVMPIGGTYRQMIAYRELAREMGYTDDRVLFADNSREVIFSQNGVRFGKQVNLPHVYVDQISGETVEKYIVLDRQK